MKRLKLWARITEALVFLAGLAVLACVLALEDIFNGNVYPEWIIVRVSFVVIVLCLVSTFITLYYVFRLLGRAEGAPAAGPVGGEGLQSPPAARRMRARMLPGKRPSTKTARPQRKRTK
jgi:hypothetical protein